MTDLNRKSLDVAYCVAVGLHLINVDHGSIGHTQNAVAYGQSRNHEPTAIDFDGHTLVRYCNGRPMTLNARPTRQDLHDACDLAGIVLTPIH